MADYGPIIIEQLDASLRHWRTDQIIDVVATMGVINNRLGHAGYRPSANAVSTERNTFLNQLSQRTIETHSHDAASGDDMLSALMSFRDDHADTLDDNEILDQVMSFLLAGTGPSISRPVLVDLWKQRTPDLMDTEAAAPRCGCTCPHAVNTTAHDLALVRAQHASHPRVARR